MVFFLSFLQKKHAFLLAIPPSFIAFSCAFSQVNVNQSALNNLGPAHKAAISPHKKKKVIHHHSHTTDTAPKDTKPQSVSPSNINQKPVVLPTIPDAPPPVPVFRDPDIKVPLHPPAPPPMPKINPQAKGEAIITDHHTLILFAPDSDELNENMMKAVMDFANLLKQHPDTQVYLNAYSHGTADDISTPRRNALNRGLTIRAVLINQGIPATRIYLITKGIPEKADNKLNPDHVEMVLSSFIPK